MLRRRTVGWAASARHHTAGLSLLDLVHPMLSTDAIRGRQGRVQHGDWASQKASRVYAEALVSLAVLTGPLDLAGRVAVVDLHTV